MCIGFLQPIIAPLYGNSIKEDDNERSVSLRFEARADYQRSYLGADLLKNETGFRGNVVNFVLDGTLSDKFGYRYRHRLNSFNVDKAFFDAVDMLYLEYKPTQNLQLKLGKWIVFVGGWEFEPAPIDVYQLGEFTYHFPCYQWGITMSYSLPSLQDQLHLQICQSPYRQAYGAEYGIDQDMYAINLAWTARHGFFEPLWSINFMEYAPRKFINYISLGNRFYISDKLRLDVDVMNRADQSDGFLFSNYSLFGQLAYQPNEALNIFAKGSYDHNSSGRNPDHCLFDGTDIGRVGLGVEFFPLRNSDLRLHAIWNYSFGDNPNPNAVLWDKMNVVNVGVTWRMPVIIH